MSAGEAPARETVLGVLLCAACTEALRGGAAGLRKNVRLCATCKPALRAKYVDGRWRP